MVPGYLQELKPEKQKQGRYMFRNKNDLAEPNWRITKYPIALCRFTLEQIGGDNKNFYKLEALRERRPPWPRQIITLILPTVKMLSLGCERLPTPLKKKRKKKVLDHYLHHDLGMLPLLRCFFCSFTHLTIPRSPPKFNPFFLVLLRTRP